MKVLSSSPMAAYSELLLLTADFSLDEREYTPRAGVWIDEPSSQLRYEESGATSIRVQASQISQKNPLEVPCLDRVGFSRFAY